MNLFGIYTLFKKEVFRFTKVGLQTVGAPIVSSLLFLFIFSSAFQGNGDIYPNVSYLHFLVPGLVMMSIMQNAFANVSSSLIQSKVSGSIVFILLPPLSNYGFLIAFVGAAILRGFFVAIGILAVSSLFTPIWPEHLLWVIVFIFIGGAMLGTLGFIAGVFAEKFDQTALFQNFFIMPLTYLAGVFYSIKVLPPLWQHLSRYNPFFYLVDAFRYGFFSHSDVAPTLSLAITCLSWLGLTIIALLFLKTGYKIKS